MSVHTFSCIDAHTCGNPVRLVVEGVPDLVGSTMMEKRNDFIQRYDWIRKALMFEPRGHDMMSGSMLFPPEDTQNDAGVLFIETSGCLPMCGHGTIGTVTIAIEAGLIQPKRAGHLRLETPAGLVEVEYSMTADKVTWVKLFNVPSFLHSERLSIDSEHLGPLTFDVAYGGNFYAIIDPQDNFRGLEYHTAESLITYSRSLRAAINEKYPDYFVHPLNKSINHVSHILWTGKPLHADSSGRNAVFYGDKAIDRSPCGTGTSARLAQLWAKGTWPLKKPFTHESYIGSTFSAVAEEVTKVGDFSAIKPSVKGWARRYGINTITVDPNDPYAYGFQVI